MALRYRATSLCRLLKRERYVAEYWYLCRRAARRFMRRGLDRADLEQVGAIGLLKAIDRYDPMQTAPFEAYAWLLIIGELMHHVRDSERFLRAPRAVRDLERRWAAAERELWSLLGREPLENEVVHCLAATPAQVREIRTYRARSHVLSFELSSGFEPCVPSSGIEEMLDRLTVDRLLQSLSPLERQIVVSIDLDGATVVELAARLGYSRRHVTRLHRAAIDRLKSSSEVGAPRGAEASCDVSVPYRR